MRPAVGEEAIELRELAQQSGGFEDYELQQTDRAAGGGYRLEPLFQPLRVTSDGDHARHDNAVSVSQRRGFDHLRWRLLEEALSQPLFQRLFCRCGCRCLC